MALADRTFYIHDFFQIVPSSTNLFFELNKLNNGTCFG